METIECKLVEQLRSLCYENGSEIDPCKSAEILHKLGNLYANRAPNKVRFIQSAVLLNAALRRDPKNAEEILNDLKKLCSKVLSESKAHKDKADLVEISKTIFQAVQRFRKDVKQKLEDLPMIESELSKYEMTIQETNKIKQVEKIQDYITDTYSEIMRSVASHCEDILGEPPCQFAVVGMGSLARSEITPYSDFENVIVLENKYTDCFDYEYFRWFSVIFQIILVNLGETLIPSVAIPSLNNFLDKTGKNNWFYDKFTKSGICFDGLMPHACKSPLGRYYKTEKCDFTTELIRTASNMVDYLDSEEDLKNGYHLADVLTQTCFVYGDRSVYDCFNGLRKDKLEKQRRSEQLIKQLTKQVDEDKSNFEIWKSLESLHRNLKSNMKQIIYRTITIFLSALGKKHDLESSSSFSVIKELTLKGLISSEDEHKLLYAVAIACEVRLRVYMKEGRANNQITKGVAHNRDYITELFDLIGEKSTIDYFNIAHSLQEGLPDFKSSYDNLSFPEIRFTIPAIYYFLNEYEKSVRYFRSELENNSNNHEKVYAQFRIGFALFYMRKYQEAIKEFLDVKTVLSNLSMLDLHERNTTERKTDIALADCYRSLKMYDKALEHYQLAEPIKDITEMNNLGVVYLKLKEYERAGKHFEKTIEALKSNDKHDKKTLAMLIYNRGRCFQEDKKYKDALLKLNESLNLRKAVTLDYDLDEDIASTRYNIGRCYMFFGDLDKAEEEIEAAIAIQNRLPEKRSDPVISDSLHYYGRCQFLRQNYEEALEYFRRENDIRSRLPVEQNTDADNVSNCRKYIADCYVKLGKETEARFYYDMENQE